MKFFCYGLVLAVALASGLTSAEDTVELTDVDFDSTLETMDTALVMFYAPWYVLFYLGATSLHTLPL